MGFETNLVNNAKRKKEKCKNPETNLKSKYKKVKFTNIVISKLGVFDSSSLDFLEMLEDLKFDKTCRHYVVKKIMAIAVRTSHYVFCRGNKEWDNPELATFRNFSLFSNSYFSSSLYFPFIVNYLFREVCSCILVYIS